MYNNLPFNFPSDAVPMGPRIYELNHPGDGKRVVKRVKDFRLFDTARVVLGSALSKGQSYDCFNVAAGKGTTPFNTAAPFNKILNLDTNLKGTGGQLSAGYFMQVLSIQFAVWLSNSLDTVPFGVGTTINPTRSTDASGDNSILALMKGVSFQFIMDDTSYEEGPIGFYPSDFGAVGYSGAVATGVNNLGLGRGVWLTEPHWLVEQYRFVVSLLSNITCTVVNEVWIQPVLVGRMFCPVQ